MSRLPLFKRPVAALLFVLQLAGCTTWHLETLPPAELIARKHPDRLRVEEVDGKRVMFYRPEVHGDSLQGRSSMNATGSRAVTLADVRSVSTAHLHTGKTIGLVLGVPAAVLLIAGIGFAATYGGM